MPKIVATKTDWIKLGYELFSDSGEAGLNVDKMSRLLRCNKSSFYWHFKTKKDFIQCLIDYWINTDTVLIIDKVNEQVTAQKRLLKLVEIACKKDANLDFIFYLKKYSQSNKAVAKIVEQIDSKRIAFVGGLLVETGYSKKEAALKAGLFYKYIIGYHEMIRYKKQKKNYLSKVLLEINQFISLDEKIKK